jgi:hypothetical protein
MVTRETSDGCALSNDVDVVITTNRFRAARGRTVLCAIFDEVAFWRSEITSTPDIETYRAIKPSLATLSESMLIGISSPDRRSAPSWRSPLICRYRPDEGLVISGQTFVRRCQSSVNCSFALRSGSDDDKHLVGRSCLLQRTFPDGRGRKSVANRQSSLLAPMWGIAPERSIESC